MGGSCPDGGVRMFRQVSSKNDRRCVAQAKQSLQRAGPYQHIGIAGESSQQGLIVADSQPSKTRRGYRAYAGTVVPQGMGSWPAATGMSIVSQCTGCEGAN